MKIMDIKTELTGLGVARIADACEVSPQAVYKWMENGRLPRTEWTGETNYAQIIERLSGGKVKRSILLRKLAATA